MNGWLLVDKPPGMSSFAVVACARKALKIKKIGHAGTLDPLASGVLALALGEATKTVAYLMAQEKVYDLTIRWGQQTTTDDQAGEAVHTSPQRPSIAQLESALPLFCGTISQVPPQYSAIKLAGRCAYKIARRGQEVEIAPREVTILSCTHVARLDADHDSFLVRCSKGTYMRSLARDLGTHLQCYGHAAHIRRLQSGAFRIENTISLASLKDLGHKEILYTYLISIPDALDDIPAVRLGEMHEQRLRHGLAVTDVLVPGAEGHIILGMTQDGRPIGLCRYEDGHIIPSRLFNI